MRYFDEIRKYNPAQIREIRLRNKLSQNDLSRFLGVSVKAVEYWEKGDRVPSEPVCRLLCLLEQAECQEQSPFSESRLPRLPFEIEKPSRHFLHNRKFYCEQIHQTVTWKDINGNLFLLFQDNGSVVRLKMPVRFRNNKEEETYWNVIGSWEIENYFEEKKFEAKAGELIHGKLLFSDARK